MNKEMILVSYYERADKLMLYVLAGLFALSLCLAPWYGTWMEAVLIGGASLGAVASIVHMMPGSVLSRVSMGAAFMIMTALHIHQAQGMVEIHFGVFVLLAILLYYRDWVAVVSGAATIAVHHLTFYFLQKGGAPVWLLEETNFGIWIVFVHAAYVVAETALIVYLTTQSKKDVLQSIELLLITSKITSKEKIDLTIRSSGETEVLNEFDSYTSQVEDMVKEVNAMIIQLNDNSKHLHALTNSMNSLSNAQANESNTIANSADQLNEIIRDVSSNAKSAAESAQEIDRSAQQTRVANGKTSSSMQEMAKQISQAVTAINDLNQKTNNIGGVLSVIRGIADQTNLLALNAAIEAARAGEQGRGFAVVADEVRTLAQRSQDATKEIDDMIEALQHESQSAVEVIQSTQNFVDTCVQNTQESIELMEQASKTIKILNDMNALIAQATGKQESLTHTIDKHIAAIVQNTQETLELSKTVSASEQTLNEITGELKQVADHFQTS